jgi:hypothetical protein
MNSATIFSETTGKPSRLRRPNPDRIGVAASILCAVHCAVTPILFLFAPAFGKVWAHPASHWLVALFVVPLAVVMLRSGFRRHRRPWIVACGVIGIFLVVAGAAIPYTGLGKANEASDVNHETTPHTPADSSAAEEEFVYVVEEEDESEAEAPACADSCCPSLGKDADGNLKLHLPLASIVTTLGGLALIATHLGNLACCRRCGTKAEAALL